jgi:hypothetical protein
MRGGRLSGSLTTLTDGTAYIVGGSNITVVSQSNGSIQISLQGPSSEVSASYLVLGATASLANERVFTPGTGLSGTDGGANGAYTLAINDSIIATVSGTTFSGATKHSLGLSGSLTNLTDGTSYLIAGSNVTITSASNGAVTISATAGGGDSAATYIVLSATGSLSAERVLTLGTGLSGSDGGAGGNYTLTGDGSPLYAIASGSADAFSASFTPSFTTLRNGTTLRVKWTASNTTGSTFNPNAIGAAPILKNGQPLEKYDITSGSISTLTYDSTVPAWKMSADSSKRRSFSLTAPTAVTSGTAFTVTLLANSRIIRTLSGANLTNTSYLEFTIPYDFIEFDIEGYSLDTTRTAAGNNVVVTFGKDGNADSTINSYSLVATSTADAWETKTVKPGSKYFPGDRVLITITSTTSGNTTTRVGTGRITYIAR